MVEQIHRRVPFRLLLTPCCSALLCWVNPRFPNYCPECGEHVFPKIKGCVTSSDDDAILTTKLTVPGSRDRKDVQ